jgi:hypothetical protein
MSGHRKKRRREAGYPADPETLAAASLRNPVDALDLLLAAADGGGVREARLEDKAMEDGAGRNTGGSMNRDLLQGLGDIQVETSPGEGSLGKASGTGEEGRREESVVPAPPPPKLEDFPLVQKGVLSTRKLCELVDTFCESLASSLSPAEGRIIDAVPPPPVSRMHFIFPGTYTRVLAGLCDNDADPRRQCVLGPKYREPRRNSPNLPARSFILSPSLS